MGREQVLCLFDVDGTLAKSMNKATPEMLALLKQLRGKVLIGVVGGSNIGKQQEQLGKDCLNDFDYFFSENGLCAWKNGNVLATTSIKDHLGEKNIKVCARAARCGPRARARARARYAHARGLTPPGTARAHPSWRPRRTSSISA